MGSPAPSRRRAGLVRKPPGLVSESLGLLSGWVRVGLRIGRVAFGARSGGIRVRRPGLLYPATPISLPNHCFLKPSAISCHPQKEQDFLLQAFPQRGGAPCAQSPPGSRGRGNLKRGLLDFLGSWESVRCSLYWIGPERIDLSNGEVRSTKGAGKKLGRPTGQPHDPTSGRAQRGVERSDCATSRAQSQKGKFFERGWGPDL